MIKHVILHRFVLYLSLCFLEPRQSLNIHAQADAANEVDESSLKTAVFSVMVQTSDHYKRSNMFTTAARLICSARKHESKVPFHLIFASLDEEQATFLSALGWNISNRTNEIPAWKKVYKPVYTPEQAATEHRRYEVNNRVQSRQDGWATYFKFDAWKATEYDFILISDLDVEFTANPDPILNALDTNVTFFSLHEKYHRYNYSGFSTHFMIVKPSMDTFKELVQKANSGDYIPYTNTEQDVLEDYFPYHKLPRINHTHFSRPSKDMLNYCNTTKLLQIKSPSCEDLYSVCGLPDHNSSGDYY